jgi:hypothetical protein
MTTPDEDIGAATDRTRDGKIVDGTVRKWGIAE